MFKESYAEWFISYRLINSLYHRIAYLEPVYTTLYPTTLDMGLPSFLSMEPKDAVSMHGFLK